MMIMKKIMIKTRPHSPHLSPFSISKLVAWLVELVAVVARGHSRRAVPVGIYNGGDGTLPGTDRLLILID